MGSNSRHVILPNVASKASSETVLEPYVLRDRLPTFVLRDNGWNLLRDTSCCICDIVTLVVAHLKNKVGNVAIIPYRAES